MQYYGEMVIIARVMVILDTYDNSKLVMICKNMSLHLRNIILQFYLKCPTMRRLCNNCPWTILLSTVI